MVNTASLVVITVLIAAQLVGLGLLTRLTYSVPTWASALDALEVAQIGKALPIDDWAPIGQVTAAEEKRLNDIDALIGIDQGQDGREGEKDVGEDYVPEKGGQVAEENAQIRDDDSNSECTRDPTQIHLALGGKGLVTREITKQLQSQQDS